MEAPTTEYTHAPTHSTIASRVANAIRLHRLVELRRVRWVIVGAPNNQAAHDLAAAGFIKLTAGHNGIDPILKIEVKA